MPQVLGLDAKRTGWIACAAEPGRLFALERHPTLAAALAAWPDAAAVAVTVPLGHDDPHGGRRAADRAARDLLGPHAARVPLVPPLEVFALSSDLAHERCRLNAWPDPDERTWSVRSRILEANQAREQEPRLHECHPEVSFQVLHEQRGGSGHLDRPAVYWSGLHERLRLLHDVGLRPTRSFGGIGKVEPGDVLGATVAAWTAGRIAAGTARHIPAAANVAIHA